MKQVKLAALVMMLMSITVLLNAQPPPGGNGGGGGGGTAPIDGGVLALLAGAIAYGYKSFKAARKGE